MNLPNNLTIQSIKDVVDHSNTYDELRECHRLIKEKKKELRKLHNNTLELSPLKQIMDDAGNDEGDVLQKLINIQATFQLQTDDFKQDVVQNKAQLDQIEQMFDQIETLDKAIQIKMSEIIWGVER